MKPRNISLTPRPETFERNLEGAYDWDVTRPLAEQWPWSPMPHVLTPEQKQAAADFDKMCDEVLPTEHAPAIVDPSHDDSKSAWQGRIIQGLRDLGANDSPARPLGDPNWQDKVHEQTRHDVAASVARHAELRCAHEDSYGSLASADGVCMVCGVDLRSRPALISDLTADLVAAGGSPPYPGSGPCASGDPHSDFTERFKSEHDDSEPTQVGAVDARFDGTDVEL